MPANVIPLFPCNDLPTALRNAADWLEKVQHPEVFATMVLGTDVYLMGKAPKEDVYAAYFALSFGAAKLMDAALGVLEE